MIDTSLKYIVQLYGLKFLKNQDRRRKEISEIELPEMEIPHSDLSHILTGEDEGACAFRFEYDKYLELAFRHEVVNTDLKRRLMSTEWTIFFQARNELMGAYFFENILLHEISFHPKGHGNSIGEFLVLRAKCPNIFVEVKSPVREIQNFTWAGNDSLAIKSNIVRARKQMPSDGENLVLLSSRLRVQPSDHDMLPVLYGIFKPADNTRISAVATLDDNYSWKLSYSFNVYHNPYAKKPIHPDVFKGWPQVVLGADAIN